MSDKNPTHNTNKNAGATDARTKPIPAPTFAAGTKEYDSYMQGWRTVTEAHLK